MEIIRINFNNQKQVVDNHLKLHQYVMASKGKSEKLTKLACQAKQTVLYTCELTGNAPTKMKEFHEQISKLDESENTDAAKGKAKGIS